MMKKTKNSVKKQKKEIIVWTIMILMMTGIIQGTGRIQTVIWEDNFDDETIDDWIITGRHYVVSTKIYTNWNGSATATGGKLAFTSENKWEDWTNDRIMNATWSWHLSPLTLGQWSFDVYPGANNFISISIMNHFTDPDILLKEPNTSNETLAYDLIILTSSYEANNTGAAFVSGGFESPTGITKEDFTGEPCFIFLKSGTSVQYTLFALEEIPDDISTTEVINVDITRDNSSKFTIYVNGKTIISVTDENPPSTSLATEGYYFGIFSFGGGSWVDNINVTYPITKFPPKGPNAGGIVLFISGLGTLIIIRRKRRG